MTDCHPESGPLYILDTIVAGTFERQKDFVKKFGFHSSSVIFKDKFVVTEPIPGYFFVDVYGDLPIFLCIFDCIGEDIHQYLLDALYIARHIFML